jgi:hypothetical protein
VDFFLRKKAYIVMKEWTLGNRRGKGREVKRRRRKERIEDVEGEEVRCRQGGAGRYVDSSQGMYSVDTSPIYGADALSWSTTSPTVIISRWDDGK